MMRRFLVFGMLAGLLASLFAFGFASLAAEPQIDAAIALEESGALGEPAAAAHPHDDAGAAPDSDGGDEAAVSRGTQKGIGLLAALGLYGIAMGGLFAIACTFAYGRIGAGGMRGTAGIVALAGFTAVALVPFLKYPANPPAVGDADTLDRRTGLYVVMVVVTVLAALIAAAVGRMLAARLGSANAALTAAGIFGLLVVVAAVLMPTVSEVPVAFPADLLWRFRLASLGTQAVLWAALGMAFGPLAHRTLHSRRAGAGQGALGGEPVSAARAPRPTTG